MARTRIAASIACHAAIKVNMPLDATRMEWLLQELAEDRSSYKLPARPPDCFTIFMEGHSARLPAHLAKHQPAQRTHLESATVTNRARRALASDRSAHNRRRSHRLAGRSGALPLFAAPCATARASAVFCRGGSRRRECRAARRRARARQRIHLAPGRRTPHHPSQSPGDLFRAGRLPDYSGGSALGGGGPRGSPVEHHARRPNVTAGGSDVAGSGSGRRGDRCSTACPAGARADRSRRVASADRVVDDGAGHARLQGR